jgi:Xaa-Pro aminopeptidase
MRSFSFLVFYLHLLTIIITGFSFMNPLNSLRRIGISSRFPRFLSVSFSTSVVPPKLPGNNDIVQEVRSLMKKEAINAFIVPTDDPHMSEYTAPYFNRREFISGFTGSAGTAVLTSNESFLFTDGRYYLQAELELPSNWTLMRQGTAGVPNPLEFLSTTLPSGSTVGIDPTVHSIQSIRKMQLLFGKKNLHLKLLDENIIDRIWEKQKSAARPLKPSSFVRIHPLESAGKSIQEKIADLQVLLKSNEVHGLILSSLDEIMWVYNLRGKDVPCNPVSICYAMITKGER